MYGSGDGKTLWAVGADGTILHSADGATWRPQASGTTNYLFSVYGTGDGKTLWAVGERGTILHSTDGATWQPQARGTTDFLFSVYGSGDGKTLWAVGTGGTILRSADGATWQPQTSGTTNDLLSVYGSGDGKTLWAVGAFGTILHSADGVTWQPQLSGTTNYLNSVYGTGDGKTLWAVGAGGTILHSVDGATWKPQTSGATNYLHSVYGSGDGKTLWAVGTGGTILTTHDGGATWTKPRYRYRPALWVWPMVALAGTLLVSGMVRLQRPPVAPKQSIENAALSDQPATKLEQDLLDAADTVLALAEFLRNRNTEPPVTLSVEGDWGTGKTSIMRMLDSELRRAQVPTVWFNAWHNEGEERMLAFLLESIRQQAFPRWWDPRGIPFRMRLLALRFERWPVILLLLVAATLFILHPALDWLLRPDTEDAKRVRDIVAWLHERNWA
ncbi:MAG: YCF48-related protein, partial [Bryobacteraceae bacterium]